jgi:plasmid stabilization system protein ParE
MVVEWTPEAKRDLTGILDYYGSRNFRAAVKIVNAIDSAVLRMGRMPLAAPVELLLSDRPEGFRSVVVRRIHKLVYYIDDKVNIVAVWDCRRNPMVLREFVTRRKKQPLYNEDNGSECD